MAKLEVEEITFSPASIRAALARLEKVIADHRKMKAHLEAVLRLQDGKGSGTNERRGSSGKKPTLREAILAALARSRKPLKPIELRDKLLASGYQTQATPQNFYISVFATAAKEPGVGKTNGRFHLKKAPSSPKAAKRKKKKKAARKKRQRG